MKAVRVIGCTLAVAVATGAAATTASAHPGPKKFPSWAADLTQQALKASGQYSSVSCRLIDHSHHVSCALTLKGTSRKGTMTEHCVAKGVLAVLSDRLGVISRSVLPLHCI
jgi:hypothetical protein